MRLDNRDLSGNLGAQGFGKLGLGGRNGSNRVFGQKIGSNDKHNEWKLFIGQVPLEVGPSQPQCNTPIMVGLV
jgi:hypothetical protein